MEATDGIIIQIETSAEICSAALSKKGKLLDHITLSEPFVHSRSLSTIVEELLKRNLFTYSDLSAVAVSRGPGSYTGLRVGYATAKGLCYALDIPLITISTLQILAFTIKNQLEGSVDLILPLIDARRMEAYAAHYDQQLNILKEDHAWIIDKLELQKLSDRYQKIAVGGNALQKIKGLFQEVDPEKWVPISGFCTAKEMTTFAWHKLQSGKLDSVAYSEPFYLKPPNITRPKTLLA
jgi:tRNA threonylcarbamoyladenosine biosynthesis protein TsaB